MSNVNALLLNFLGETKKDTNTIVTGVFDIVKSAKKATAQQSFTYKKLCADKNVEENDNSDTWDYDTMTVEINKLLAMKRVQLLSEGQKTTIISICERNGWEVPSFAGLVGGREGTASKLIQELMDLERTYNTTRPLTEKQKEMILDMYYCPDVNFEDLNEVFGTHSQVIDGKVYWTRMNIDQMNISLEDKVTQTEAREFLNKYKGVFYDWKTTRLTEPQMRRIQGLQERSYMEEMSDTKLLQFSKKDAERYIAMLESSLRDKEIVKFPKEATMDDDRGNKDVAKANKIYLDKVDNLIYSLYASMGQSGRDEEIASMTDTDVKELIELASEMNGKDAIRELANEILTADEVDEIFGTDEVAVDTSNEYAKADNICEEIIKLAMSSPTDMLKKGKTYKLAVQKMRDRLLISEELYDNMQKVFEKVGV